jgi:F-type H+-transporting ATPase subunit alpha
LLVQALDVLTPLAHGCALLAAGSDPAATTDLLLRIACNLSSPLVATTESPESCSPQSKDSASGPQVRVVYVAAGCTQDEINQRVDRLRTSGALANCTIVAAPDSVPLAQQYAALCAGVAIGERVRDAGGKAVVLLDTAECIVGVWKTAVRLALGDTPQKDAGVIRLHMCPPLLNQSILNPSST